MRDRPHYLSPNRLPKEAQADEHVNPVMEMADLLSAVRAYQLNAAAVQAAKSMIQQSLQILS
jgi:flagellar basal body rod protein FlgC